MVYKTKEEKLNDQEIIGILDDFLLNDFQRYSDNERYYQGNNTYITSEKRSSDDPNVPDWKIPVSYAKKMITTVTGYMYKPGTVTYTIKDKNFKEEINKIFTINNEKLKTSQIGEKTSLYGVAYELHYTHVDSPLVPRWALLNATEVIPIFDYSIEPVLKMFIRFYNVIDSYDQKNKDRYKTTVEVYYKDEIVTYLRFNEIDQKTKKETSKLEKQKTEVNVYGVPPLVIYKNNATYTSDFEHVKKLIDAYDTLCSDSLNEFDRFAAAYLLLVGERLDPEDVKNIKKRRIFENLESSDAVKFLTKDINENFIKFMKDWLREELHEQTCIPDFLAMSGGDRLSGSAIEKLVYSFEFLCSSKEMFFKEGLYQRFKLIDKIVNISNEDPELITQDIKILMQRNKHYDDRLNAEIFSLLDNRGITRKTLIENYARFVDDPEEELKNFELEQKKAKEQMLLDFEQVSRNNDINPMQSNRQNIDNHEEPDEEEG